jgi:hypothetical protein
LTIALIVIIITGVSFYLLYLPEAQSSDLKMDWRVKLQIINFRDNFNSTPPAGIGTPGGYWYNHTYDRVNGTWLGPQGYASLSTRDGSGTIYIQSSVCCPAYVFTLSYFFSEWGQRLSRTCIMDYCYSPGESLVYDSNNDNVYRTPEPVIHAAGNHAPADNTTLSTDPHVKFIDTDNNGVWDPGEPVVYDTNNNGIYDGGDVIITISEPPRGTPLKSDPKIKFVDSNSNGKYDAPVPPMVLESNHDTTRCDPSVLGLSDGYQWTIWEWRPTIAAAAKCYPAS